MRVFIVGMLYRAILDYQARCGRSWPRAESINQQIDASLALEQLCREWE